LSGIPEPYNKLFVRSSWLLSIYEFIYKKLVTDWLIGFIWKSEFHTKHFLNHYNFTEERNVSTNYLPNSELNSVLAEFRVEKDSYLEGKTRILSPFFNRNFITMTLELFYLCSENNPNPRTFMMEKTFGILFSCIHYVGVHELRDRSKYRGTGAATRGSSPAAAS
jgi:hypothetical protein